MLATLRQIAEFIQLFQVHGRKQSFRRNDIIIHAGEDPPGIFYICEGLVKATSVTRFNEENLLIIRKEDEIFPFIYAITGEYKNITYQALTPVVVLKIDRPTFLNYLTRHPDAMAPILDMAVDFYTLYAQRVLNLEYRSVRERLISFLLIMGNRFGRATPEGLLIDVPLRHQDIASSINATRETTSRELAALERKGLIANRQTQIALLDVDSLKSHLE